MFCVNIYICDFIDYKCIESVQTNFYLQTTELMKYKLEPWRLSLTSFLLYAGFSWREVTELRIRGSLNRFVKHKFQRRKYVFILRMDNPGCYQIRVNQNRCSQIHATLLEQLCDPVAPIVLILWVNMRKVTLTALFLVSAFKWVFWWFTILFSKEIHQFCLQETLNVRN